MAAPHLQDTAAWQALVSDRFDRRELSSREWRSIFGLPINCVNSVWDKYMSQPVEDRYVHLAPKKQLDFLLMLNWMKAYSVEDDMAVKWKISKPVFRRACIHGVQWWGLHLDEIHWEDRLVDPVPSRFSLFGSARVNYDGIRCLVQRPSIEPLQSYYYSGKEGDHCILYELASKICDNIIVWCPSWLALPGSRVDLAGRGESSVIL